MSATALRPRTITELIDAAFQLLRRYYLQLVSIAAVFLMPVIVIQALGFATPQFNPVRPEAGGPFSAYRAIGSTPPGYLLAVGAALILGILGTSGVVVGVSESYVNDRVEVGRSIQRVLSRLLPILGGTLGMIVVVAFAAMFMSVALVFFLGIVVSLSGTAGPRGAVFAIVTGFMTILVVGLALLATYARIFAVPMVIVLEGASIGQAFSRSIALTRGSVWRVMGVFMLVFVIFAAVFALVLFATTMLLSQVPRFMTIYNVIGTSVNIFAYPLYTVFITLLYYDLRIRRDGFDLEIMAKELTGAPAVGPA